MLLSALLIAATAFSSPAMVIESIPGRAAHHHGASHHNAPSRTTSECCDLCWVACAAPPGAPALVTFTIPAVRVILVVVPAPPVLRTVLLPHRFPFSLGPPSLQA
jgi:hypothetical protein